jgi:putative cell wall-binding protein
MGAKASHLIRRPLVAVAIMLGTLVATVGAAVTTATPATAAPTVTRVFGADRFATSTGVSASYFSPGVPVAYVATGAAYADALAGGPAAARGGGPLLLISQLSVPATVVTELQRLQPGRIVVLGGAEAISDAVLAQLHTYTTGTVTRIAGADRYATAALLAEQFPAGSPVFVATGTNYPDALAGVAAAAAEHAAIVLTDPNTLPASAAAALAQLQPSSITILGGNSAVSPAVQTALAAYSASITRLAGTDRYDTAAKVAAAAFPDASAAYVASGITFADALAGGPVAGLRGEPLLLATPTCVPAATVTAGANLTSLTLLGGTAALSAAVASWTQCPVAPPAPVAPASLRLTFYYPWFPLPSTSDSNFHPSDGNYSTADPAEDAKQLAEMRYAGLNGAIFSWEGQSDTFSKRLSTELSVAHGTPFKWSVYYELEGQGNPTVAALTSDLNYLYTTYAGDPNFLRINGKPVIFVWPDAADGCSMLARWASANSDHRWYVVQKEFFTSPYRSCPNQPDAWHQYTPANRVVTTPWSYSVSPGFWHKGQASQLARSASAFDAAVATMKASNAQFELVTTWNEWIDGSSIESATEWASPSGYGGYVDILHKYFGSA